MNKKIVIIGIIIAILIVGFIFYTQNTIKIGNSYFTIPEGYHVIDEGDYVNLTSGNNHICLYKEIPYDSNKSISIYEKDKHKENDTLKFSNITSGDVKIIKAVSKKHPNLSHYWFVKDGNSYEAFSWHGDSGSDDILINLIKTMKPTI